MTLAEMNNQLTGLGAQIRAQANRVASMAADQSVAFADIEAQQTVLNDLQKRRQTLQALYDEQAQNERQTLRPAQQNQQQDRSLRDMLGSNEYSRAFAYAIRKGINKQRAAENEKTHILLDALTIGGGDPAGEDGGFLVPEDIDHQIRELRRELNPLADYFNVETVGTNSGWRVMDTAPSTGMPEVDEMGTIDDDDDQPTFAKVTFTLKKYGLILPVSHELASDEAADLFGYLSRWFAKKDVIKENALLLALLAALDGSNVTAGEELKAMKGVLNKVLDPAIGLNAIMITNQSGFDVLDNMTDGTGRPLLNYDAQTGTPKILNGKRVVVMPDGQLANVTGKAPIYIGDMKQFATLFMRGPLEMASTDIGGSAWTTDSIQVRGIKRMAAVKFDASAAAKRMLTI